MLLIFGHILRTVWGKLKILCGKMEVMMNLVEFTKLETLSRQPIAKMTLVNS